MEAMDRLSKHIRSMARSVRGCLYDSLSLLHREIKRKNMIMNLYPKEKPKTNP